MGRCRCGYATENDVRTLSRGHSRLAGGQGKFAAMHGVTSAYLSAVLHGKKRLSRRMLAAIGLEPVVVYRVAALHRTGEGGER